MAPPPTPLSITQPSATAPPSPSPATAGAPQSAHPYPQPQVYSPTAPTSPRQDRPPPPAPQTIPASYGAIRPPHPQGHSRGPQRSRPRTPLSAGNSDSESNSSSEDEEERIAAGERRRRRKAIKKHLSGCTCNKFCWLLIFLVLLSFWTSPIEKTIKDPCSLMAERRLEPELEIYSLGEASHMDISLDIMEPILGDVTVVEADNWSQDWIGVNVYKTFSHPDVNDIINFSMKFDSSYTNVAIRADLNSTDPTEREREARFMKNHCARIDFEFVFPKYSDNVKRLIAKTHKGDIRIRTEGTTMIFRELHLETFVGDVLFEAGTVQTSTTIKTGRGKVQGTIRTLEKVEASTAMGDIALVVDARPGLHGSGDGKFNITLQSDKSSIDLGLSEKYTGLFSLESGIDRPTFGLSPNYTNTIRISKRTATLLSGWVWDGFSDRPRSLPSVSATALNGRVHAQVLNRRNKK
ncbi:hypothetical protein BGX30_011135 [Mortierella sp. GBA39]|nr:hypothetical protein BGX30_011135 [Mortierella sp. GBA39]